MLRLLKPALPLLVLCAAATCVRADESVAELGAFEPIDLRVQAADVAPGATQTVQVAYHQSDYLALHFSQFDLPAGAHVVVRSADNATAFEYGSTAPHGGFSTPLIPGDSVFVDYVAGRDVPEQTM